MTFIEKRKASWQQFESLLSQVNGLSSLRRLNRIEVRQLGNSYRQIVSDLSIARVESRDQQLIDYLNNLMIRAHSLIYRAEIYGRKIVWNFYRNEFPTIFRQTYQYPLAVFSLFLFIAL